MNKVLKSCVTFVFQFVLIFYCVGLIGYALLFAYQSYRQVKDKAREIGLFDRPRTMPGKTIEGKAQYVNATYSK